MRTTLIFIVAIVCLLLSACSHSSNTQTAGPSPWRTPKLENTLYMELDHGVVVIELNPLFAPLHIARVKHLVRQGFYNGLGFYRVIDGFVAQGGSGENEDDGLSPKPPPSHRPLAIEPTIKSIGQEKFTLVQSPDLFADKTGFIQGFAVGRSQDDSLTWLNHCPGVVAMSRNNQADTATTDFYIVIGQAPRYLDKIMTIFGRVIEGMPVVQAIKRGHPTANGMIADATKQSIIRKMVVAADLPPAQQRQLQIERTDNQAFRQKLQARLDRNQPFFYKKPPRVLDVCQVPIRTRSADISNE